MLRTFPRGSLNWEFSEDSKPSELTHPGLALNQHTPSWAHLLQTTIPQHWCCEMFHEKRVMCSNHFEKGCTLSCSILDSWYTTSCDKGLLTFI